MHISVTTAIHVRISITMAIRVRISVTMAIYGLHSKCVCVGDDACVLRAHIYTGKYFP